jgi:hypothetical protein
MNARLNAFIVPDLLLTQPPLSSPTSYPTCCSRSYQFHRTRPAAHAASLINIQTQPAAAAMDNYRNALLNTPSADTHVSGLTRCSGNPADTDFYFHRTRPAAHAATLNNTRTQPAADAMDNYRNASRPAAHAATFEHPIGVGSLTDPDIFEDP